MRNEGNKIFTTHVAKTILVSVFVVFSFLSSYQHVDATVMCAFHDGAGGVHEICFENRAACDAVPAPAWCIGSNCVESDCTVNGVPTKTTTTPLSAAGQLIGWIAWEALMNSIIMILQFFTAVLVWLIGYAAQTFDLAIAIALAGFSDLRFIEIGWTLVRDTANIFFMFALLTIAIATILRLESYGWKQLLVKLIVVALLINFSMVIASVVIDASNLLALQFIKRIYPVSDNIANIMSFGQITNTLGQGVAEDQEISLIEALSGGFTNVLRTFNFSPLQDPTAVEKLAFGVGTNNYNADVARLFFYVTIFILELIALFVFIALSALVIVRTVTLMILLVFAPFGFFAMILPVTRSISTMWWNKLFSQSFFFPAAAFMLYLSIQFGVQIKELKLTGSQTFNVALLFNYFVITALLLGSILVARHMGAHGASAAIGIGSKLKGKLQGYAGRVAGRTAVRYTAPIASTLAGSKIVSKIPFATRGLQRLTAQERGNIDEYKTSLNKYTSKELRERSTKFGTNKTARAAILEKLAERGDLEYKEGFTRDHARDSISFMRQLGRSTKGVERLDPRLIQLESGETIGAAMRRRNIRLRPEDVSNLDTSVLEDAESMRAYAETATPAVVRAFVDRGGDALNAFRKGLDAVAEAAGKTAGDLNGLREAMEKDPIRNTAVPDYIRGAPGMAVTFGYPEVSTPNTPGSTGNSTPTSTPPPAGGSVGPTIITPPSGFGGTPRP